MELRPLLFDKVALQETLGLIGDNHIIPFFEGNYFLFCEYLYYIATMQDGLD